MASLKPALISTLKADSAIAAIVVGRVSPNALPRTAARPGLVVRVASDIRGRVLAGHTHQRIARVLIECQAATDLEADGLAQAVEAFLDGFTNGGDLGGCQVVTCLQVDEGDVRVPRADGTDGGVYSRLLDYRFDYRF